MNKTFILVLIIIFVVVIIIDLFIYYSKQSDIVNKVTNETNAESSDEKDDNCNNNLRNKINPEILVQLGLNDSQTNMQNDNYNVNTNICDYEISKKVNPKILEQIGMDISKDDMENFSGNTKNIEDTFKMVSSVNTINNFSFKKINSNKLYYGLPCNFIKDDCFYDALKNSGFVLTTDITKASLVVPCSYETTEKEINDLETYGIKKNQFGDGVRIFMLNNTDHMVSKLALWKYLKEKYGSNIASNMLPHTWDLTDTNEVELFKTQHNPKKLYITKNNYQRQEGLQIHTKLETILNSRDKYILVQELLQDPYLVSGRKINLRVYVLVIKDNYSNIKLQVYKDGFMYYTPELFIPNDPSFKKNITTGYIDRQVYKENPLTHMDFRKWLDNPKRKLTDIELYLKETYPHIKLSNYIFSQIYEQLGFVFQTYETIVGTKTFGVNFQLYGVDVAINQHLKPMVMEINKGPDLGAKDGRDRELKMNLGYDILKSVGLIQNIDNKFITVLETVNINGNVVPIQNLIDC